MNSLNKEDKSSIKSTDQPKKNLCKKLSNTKIINGICNTAFTFEEKLQSKGYSNLKNSEDGIKLSNDDLTKKDTEKDDSMVVNYKNNEIIFNDQLNTNNNDDKINDEYSVNSSKLETTSKSVTFDKNLINCKKCDTFYSSNFNNCQCNSKCNCNNVPNTDETYLNMPDEKIVKKNIFSVLKGILLAFISSIFFSLTTVIVKYVNNIDAGQMALYRFGGMLLFTIPVVLDSKEAVFGPAKLRHWVLLRGLAGATSIYLRYSALHYLPISNATVIVLSMPVFVCIFGKIFLKEACGLFHFIALSVTIIGIAFTSKLDVIISSTDEEAFNHGIDRQSEIYGLLSGLGATLVGSSAYILVRKVKNLHYSVILFNFSWVALLESSFLTFFIHDGIKIPTDSTTPWLLMSIGIISFYGQMMLTKALKAEEAALVSVTRSAAEVFFAFIFQILFFKEMPTTYSIIGATLVTSAVLLTSVRKYVENLPEKNLTRRIFWFTLL